MQRNTLIAWSAVCALAMAGCSGTPQTTLSPSAIDGTSTALNPDGSSVKATAPTDLTPRDVTVDTLRPTLRFTSAVGLYASLGFGYEIQVVNGAGNVIYTRTLGESTGTVSHTLESDLTYADNFWWRVRARLGDQAAPWSDYAPFRTLDRPTSAPVTPSAGGLPFAVPAACGPFGPGDRSACISAITVASPWWAACQAGSGVNCHRFTRSVAAALASHDPGWGLLSKNPGDTQCSWDSCSVRDGSGYGEDVVAHLDGGSLRAWDIVGGAGAPGASANWSRIEAFRPGNFWVPVPLPLGTR
jgi:hypothetical protein